ncbi:hypothetical protein ASG81_24895 [Paenibacillus sp. Soil522]|nr:hypothetical protein ASG81_24895 [Paenibacillus sp. Soil522]
MIQSEVNQLQEWGPAAGSLFPDYLLIEIWTRKRSIFVGHPIRSDQNKQLLANRLFRICFIYPESNLALR